jgi:hypothetical protein
MKAFKFYKEKMVYCYAAETKELALNCFKEDNGSDYDKVEEILETEWDKKSIDVYEDNDFDKKPFKTSIRESMYGTSPQLIYSNDFSLIS